MGEGGAHPKRLLARNSLFRTQSQGKCERQDFKNMQPPPRKRSKEPEKKTRIKAKGFLYDKEKRKL